MFEGFKDFQKGAIIGRLHTAQMRVNSAQAEADSADVRAQKNLDFAFSLAERLKQANGRIAALEAEVKRLEVIAEEALMDACGRLAQVDAFMTGHPGSPLMADSGKRFRSGKVKTKVRLIYEDAYDSRGRKLGIKEPAKRRVD